MLQGRVLCRISLLIILMITIMMVLVIRNYIGFNI